MSVFSETINTKPLCKWPHQPPIADMCPALIGKVEIVGWKEPALEQGTTHLMMSMEEFLDAHVNRGSTRNNVSVAPFFFPKGKPWGPDIVFVVRIDSARLVPVFVQMKLHQAMGVVDSLVRTNPNLVHMASLRCVLDWARWTEQHVSTNASSFLSFKLAW